MSCSSEFLFDCDTNVMWKKARDEVDDGGPLESERRKFEKTLEPACHRSAGGEIAGKINIKR
jgi:hypothetical protein